MGSTIGRSLKAAEKGAEVFKDVAKAIEGGEELVKVADDVQQIIHSANSIRGRISNIGQAILGTTIPKYFNIEAAGTAFHVNPNATKHMGEYINSLPSSHGLPLRNDLILSSFEGAVKDAVVSGTWKSSLESGELIMSGGWELVFSQRTGDTLPVISHALMKK